MKEGIESYRKARGIIADVVEETEEQYDVGTLIAELQSDMALAARNLQFERAAVLRDQIKALKDKYRIGSPSGERG